jgi:predicted nucleic acid-binding protein
VNLFVDTSVWSLAFRRDAPQGVPEVVALARALEEEDGVFATGIVLQELLQGFSGPKARPAILETFTRIGLLRPDTQDHVGAADLKVACRRRGIQIGTIDALLAELCVRHRLTMLTADGDFARIASVSQLQLWQP